MIGDKLAKAFYLVTISGEAVKTFFDGNFGIDSIVISSDLFPDDITASVALGQIVEYITTDPDIDLSVIKEEMALNPDFFPNVPPVEVTDDMQEKYDMQIAQIKATNSIPEDSIPIIMTKNFDELGDFFMVRWKMHSDTTDVVARIGIMPSEFMYLKHLIGDDPMLVAHRENSECKILLQ